MLSIYVSNIYFPSFMHPIYIALICNLVLGFIFVGLVNPSKLAMQSAFTYKGHDL